MNKKIFILPIAILIATAIVLSIPVHPVRAADQGDDMQGMGSMMNGKGPLMADHMGGPDDNGMQGDPNQPSVMIHPNGNFRVTGVTVNSVATSSNSLTASLFGFTKTVSLSGAKLLGAGAAISLGDIQAGDKLMAEGTFDANTHAITVTQLNDMSLTARRTPADIQAQIQHLLQLIQQLQAQINAKHQQ